MTNTQVLKFAEKDMSAMIVRRFAWIVQASHDERHGDSTEELYFFRTPEQAVAFANKIFSKSKTPRELYPLDWLMDLQEAPGDVKWTVESSDGVVLQGIPEGRKWNYPFAHIESEYSKNSSHLFWQSGNDSGAIEVRKTSIEDVVKFLLKETRIKL